MEKVYLATAIPIPLVGREDCLLGSSETLSLDVAMDQGSAFHDCQKKKNRKNERQQILFCWLWALLVQAVHESKVRTETRTLQTEKL